MATTMYFEETISDQGGKASFDVELGRSSFYKENALDDITQDELNERARVVCEQLTLTEQTFVSPATVKAVLFVVHSSTMVPLARQLREIAARAKQNNRDELENRSVLFDVKRCEFG